MTPATAQALGSGTGYQEHRDENGKLHAESGPAVTYTRPNQPPWDEYWTHGELITAGTRKE